MELKAFVELQGRELTPDLVDAPDQFLYVPRRVPVADPDLVFLRIEILLGAWAHREVLAELVSAVDPVAGGKRRRQDQANFERRTPAMLQVFVQDVRRVREEVRPHVFADLGPGELREVIAQFQGAVPPREIGVGLGESRLREIPHHLGPRERFREEDCFRVLAFHFGDAPFPERKRLGMRVIDAEDRHPVARPEEEDALQLLPQTSGILAVEVEWIDVLVFLRWVFGVLDRPVRPVAEPFRMFTHPGVIG